MSKMSTTNTRTGCGWSIIPTANMNRHVRETVDLSIFKEPVILNRRNEIRVYKYKGKNKAIRFTIGPPDLLHPAARRAKYGR